MKRNIDLVERYRTGQPKSQLKYLNTPAGRLFLLGDVARMRLAGIPDKGLNLIEAFMKDFEITDWTHGDVVRSLLHIDAGRIHTGIRMAEKLADEHPRHPHVRNLVGELSRGGYMEMLLRRLHPSNGSTIQALTGSMDGCESTSWPLLQPSERNLSFNTLGLRTAGRPWMVQVALLLLMQRSPTVGKAFRKCGQTAFRCAFIFT